MRLLYLGYYVDEVYFQNMLERGNTDASQAAHNFEGRLLSEFSRQIKSDDWEILSYVSTNDAALPDESYIGNKKITVIKISKERICDYLRAYRLFNEFIEKKNVMDCSVLMYSVHPIFSLQLALIKKKRNLTITTICSELPQYRAAGNKTNLTKKIKLTVQARENRMPDRYVLFTDSMKTKIPVRNKPYIVIEGIAPDTIFEPQNGKANIVMYAGGFGAHNNLNLLINACEASVMVSELWLCGTGSCLEEVKKRQSDKVKYLGNLSHNEVMILEKRAKILVNLRDPRAEITKYAFPSKILEYITAGAAVLSTRLQGIPSEYFDYIYSIDELTLDNVRTKIDQILSMDYSDYTSACKKAQNFVKNEKNTKKQISKILDFIMDFRSNI